MDGSPIIDRDAGRGPLPQRRLVLRRLQGDPGRGLCYAHLSPRRAAPAAAHFDSPLRRRPHRRRARRRPHPYAALMRPCCGSPAPVRRARRARVPLPRRRQLAPAGRPMPASRLPRLRLRARQPESAGTRNGGSTSAAAARLLQVVRAHGQPRDPRGDRRAGETARGAAHDAASGTHRARRPHRPRPRARVSASTGSRSRARRRHARLGAARQRRRLVGRSFKYHRPRGILTAGTEEPSALVDLSAAAAPRAEPPRDHAPSSSTGSRRRARTAGRRCASTCSRSTTCCRRFLPRASTTRPSCGRRALWERSTSR